MADTLERLVRFNELGKLGERVTPEVLQELRSMSAATIDRYLKPHRDAVWPEALAGTKPSHILRSTIQARTCMDDAPTTPGFYELDTVAHCGHTLKGDFLWTLDATDPLSGWTMLGTVKNKAFVNVHAGLEWVAKNSPVPIAAMDFDNGSEFMNWSGHCLVRQPRDPRHPDTVISWDIGPRGDRGKPSVSDPRTRCWYRTPTTPARWRWLIPTGSPTWCRQR